MHKLLTVEQTLERLQIGRTLLWKLSKSGKLPGVQIGTRRFYPESVVNDYLESLLENAGPPSKVTTRKNAHTPKALRGASESDGTTAHKRAG